ncbi:MAG: type II secretion system F family protein [Burkholderiales bacterium]
MSAFVFRGRNARGELIRGNLEGADSSAVADQLVRTGITPVEIKPAFAAGDLNISQLLARLQERVTPTDLVIMSRQLYTLLHAGVPILRALASLEASATNSALLRVLQDLRASLDSGKELSAAMRQHPTVFSPFYVAMVRVGEMSGRIEDVFLRMSEHLEFEVEMRGRVKSALRYPLFVIIAMSVALAIVSVFVIPTFAKMYEGFGTQLPLLTRVLIAFSNCTVNYWPLILAAIIGAIMGFRLWTATPRGRYLWDRTRLRLPIAGKIITKATLSRFAHSFALCIRSGVPLVQALSVVARVVENEFIGARIEQMRDGVERGEAIYRTAITAGVFSPVVLQMIAIGEETGALDQLMTEIGSMYGRDVEYDLKNLTSQIEPILIVGLAIMVLILALGVLTPIWGLGKSMVGKG